MAQILDLTKFKFEGELLQAISEMVFDEVIEAPEISLLHTVFPDIVTTKEVGFIGDGGLVGVAGQGCDPVAQDWEIATRMVKWQPEEWEILIHECYKDLVNAASVYSLKTGTRIADFTTTDYINIVTIVLTKAMKEFIIRFAWFNDKGAQNVSDGGIITNGVNLNYFNIIDGFWKQMLTQVTANAKQRVTISENAGANYAAQKLIPSNVRDYYLPNLVFFADMTLRAQRNAFILSTQSFYDAYKRSLKGTNLEATYVNLTEGQQTLTYDGIPIIPIPVWDKIISAYENTGTKLNNPHRAVYTTKEVLGIGCDNPNSFSNFDVWYDKDSRKVKIEAMGIGDAKLTNPNLFQLAI